MSSDMYKRLNCKINHYLYELMEITGTDNEVLASRRA